MHFSIRIGRRQFDCFLGHIFGNYLVTFGPRVGRLTGHRVLSFFVPRLISNVWGKFNLKIGGELLMNGMGAGNDRLVDPPWQLLTNIHGLRRES